MVAGSGRYDRNWSGCEMQQYSRRTGIHYKMWLTTAKWSDTIAETVEEE